MLFVMLSKTGAKYVLPMMWIILAADLLFGSILFALIQGGLLPGITASAGNYAAAQAWRALQPGRYLPVAQRGQDRAASPQTSVAIRPDASAQGVSGSL